MSVPMEQPQLNENVKSEKLYNILNNASGKPTFGTLTNEHFLTLTYAICRMESGMNTAAKNPNSSAFGLFQMLKASWIQAGYKYNIDATNDTGGKNENYSPNVQVRAYYQYLNKYVIPAAKRNITNYATAYEHQIVTAWVHIHLEGEQQYKDGKYLPSFVPAVKKIIQFSANPEVPFVPLPPEVLQGLQRIVNALEGIKEVEEHSYFKDSIDDTINDLTKTSNKLVVLGFAALAAFLIYKLSGK
jgi:hypothetical protein